MPSTKASRFQLPGWNLPLNWTPHANSANLQDIVEQFEATGAEGLGQGHDVFRNSVNETDIGDGFVSYNPAESTSTDDEEDEQVHVLFRSALSEADIDGGFVSLPLTTLREFTMLDIMNLLTDKKGWEAKVFDDDIAAKWKVEAMATPGRDVTQKMVDWCIEELRYKSNIFKATGAVSVYNGDVVKSDVAIPTELKEALRIAIRPLEKTSGIYRDYHPGSDGKVIDLVHPSLFPLIYGQSRILQDRLIGLENCLESCGTGTTITAPSGGLDDGDKNLYSENFQWLPCDVDISGDRAKITSYINNLHPQKHRELYSVIEQVITNTIPIWNMTLTPNKGHGRHLSYNRINVELKFDPDPDIMSEQDKPQQGVDEDEDDFNDRLWEWEREVRRAVQPEPGAFHPPSVPKDIEHNVFEPGTRNLKPDASCDLKRDYNEGGLQVIVKLANIELKPEKPDYEGGSWHVEGQLNEHIAATAIYYYDNENITDSHLAFRQQASTDVAEELPYPQNIHDWLFELYGCENDAAAVQEIGSVLCSEGRLITFPNILQHQVQPFKLADPSKPGHRKILALFLVDPGIRIISTANVPPQQREWWSEQVNKSFKNSGQAIGKLCTELRQKVYENVDDFPIGLPEAKEIRLKLMEERTDFKGTQDNNFEKIQFSLCEH